MAELLNQIALFLEQLIQAIGYPGIYLVMLLENVFPPIPTDPLLPFAGILVGQGKLNFLGVWATAVVGAVTGSLMLYAVGIWADENVIRTFVRRYGRYIDLHEHQLDRALRLFDRYGSSIVFIGRGVPVLRSAVSITAGMSHMSLPRFIFFSALNSLLVTGFWITVGVVLGENWPEVLALVDRLQWVIIALVIVLVLYTIGAFVRRRLRNREAKDSQGEHGMKDHVDANTAPEHAES